MNANEVRNTFLKYFESKKHKIVSSAPMVVKNDPTLMFTNAGMNQFKDYFLGNQSPKDPRVADTQKCLRVSGKHNDLEEVGHDTYHHTMFEMLGNWSFGDYFKKEAIEWAWELLVDVYKVKKDRLYATVFEGSQEDNVSKDEEAYQYWRKFLPEDRVLEGSKKDNFWEMGDTGPCGPCSELHIDLRSDDERKKINGRELVNKGNPLVIEIWNLVFIQYNRKADGSLESLPQKHVDTGMGFERLCMVVQNKKSNYDTDVFQNLIRKIEEISSLKYEVNNSDSGTDDNQVNIAMRVISDHIRAIAFSIADGQLPSNTGAGYVIRRILRRAVRYGYQTLKLEEPFLHKLVPALAKEMGEAFPELKSQLGLITQVILEEENSFYRTLSTGITKLEDYCSRMLKSDSKVIDGKTVFELYDTYGFPVDLTELIARGYGLSIDEKVFEQHLQEQKSRSRKATALQTDDWVILDDKTEPEFIGYDNTDANVKILRYRKVSSKGKDLFQLIFDQTPFYGESGGQVGDTGYIEENGIKISILDTKKENNTIIHLTQELPKSPESTFKAVVNNKRFNTACNHTATHLLHEALREILGTHVEQKGSLVSPNYLRFDFSHFSKLTDEEIEAVENLVNQKIRKNHPLEEKRKAPMKEAVEMGAMALFGEKYGDEVRVIKFGTSVELCGGNHVESTGVIGYFKITAEAAVAAGIRRIEAITNSAADKYLYEKVATMKAIELLLKGPKNPVQLIEQIINEKIELQKKIEVLEKEKGLAVKEAIIGKAELVHGINVICEKIDVPSAAIMKDIAYQIRNQVNDLFLVLAAIIDEKPNLAVMISDNLIETHKLDAAAIVRDIAKEIQGGGGGQPFFATAGGKNSSGIKASLEKARKIISEVKK